MQMAWHIVQPDFASSKPNAAARAVAAFSRKCTVLPCFAFAFLFCAPWQQVYIERRCSHRSFSERARRTSNSSSGGGGGGGEVSDNATVLGLIKFLSTRSMSASNKRSRAEQSRAGAARTVLVSYRPYLLHHLQQHTPQAEQLRFMLS